MELLLKKSIENLGRIGDVVTVRPGYARNYLLPRKLAIERLRCFYCPGRLRTREVPQCSRQQRVQGVVCSGKQPVNRLSGIPGWQSGLQVPLQPDTALRLGHRFQCLAGPVVIVHQAEGHEGQQRRIAAVVGG